MVLTEPPYHRLFLQQVGMISAQSPEMADLLSETDREKSRLRLAAAGREIKSQKFKKLATTKAIAHSLQELHFSAAARCPS